MVTEIDFSNSLDSKRQRLREIVGGGALQYPLSFQDSLQLYNDAPSLYIGTNCYAYALGLTEPYPHSEWKANGEAQLYSPGAVSGQVALPNFFTGDEMMDAVLADLVFLGLKSVSRIKRRSMRLACFVRAKELNFRRVDFHFARRDDSGLYSHKMGWISLPEILGARPVVERYRQVRIINIAQQ